MYVWRLEMLDRGNGECRTRKVDYFLPFSARLLSSWKEFLPPQSSFELPRTPQGVARGTPRVRMSTTLNVIFPCAPPGTCWDRNGASLSDNTCLAKIDCHTDTVGKLRAQIELNSSNFHLYSFKVLELRIYRVFACINRIKCSLEREIILFVYLSSLPWVLRWNIY